MRIFQSWIILGAHRNADVYIHNPETHIGYGGYILVPQLHKLARGM